ncbi:hypothetical protein PR001_g14773 [Phytophthora rubi]|uniref:Uncharacterized protein n=2 Tax=Phytophthora rubi TaxID=129364 RepID=A0A6A3LIF0_9STRA|nr:hypothetical protein PR001_g14773 [Phytophthora rubi]
MVDKLCIDVILGTDALEAFRAVVGVAVNVTRPDGQALVVTDVQGEIAEDVTVLVKGLVDFDAAVRVARSLCTVHEKKVIVEVCNPSTEEMIIKKGTPLAAILVVPESIFMAAAQSFPAEEAESASLAENASSKRESDWIHAVIDASPTAEGASSEHMSELDKVLETEPKVDISDSKLGGEKKELFTGLLDSFRDLFVETSLKPGRTDLLEFSIDTGDSAPIKQRPDRVS